MHVRNILWKKLARSNTWLSLASIMNPGVLTTSMHRQDLKIEGVDILEMDSHCSLTSSTAILRTNPGTLSNINIQHTYVKPVIQQ